MTQARTLTRLPGWPELLAAHLHAVRDQPFAWGTRDCCTFAGDCVAAITGRDPMADLRASYATEFGAARVLLAAGGLPAAVSARLGPSKSAALAARGDVVLCEMPGTGPALGVCLGVQFVAAGPHGTEYLPMAAASAAWSV